MWRLCVVILLMPFMAQVSCATNKKLLTKLKLGCDFAYQQSVADFELICIRTAVGGLKC